MRVVTVRQPWAWAIVHGGKDVENRTRNIAGSYRGPVALHVSTKLVPDGGVAWHAAAAAGMDTDRDTGVELHRGHVIGVMDLVSVHHDSDHGRGYPCSPWAFADHWHLMVENVRPLDVPIPAVGFLGLWTPDADLLAQINDQLKETRP